MILNNKPVVPGGVISLKYLNTSNLVKFLTFLAKPRMALLVSVVVFLKKSWSRHREFFISCIIAWALFGDVKIGSTVQQKRKEEQHLR